MIGTDFELPLILNGEPISIVGLLGGTKDEPLSIGKDCFRQEDNVSAEFNIPPVDNYIDFQTYIDYCIQQGNIILKDINPEYELGYMSSAIYKQKELESEQAKHFGCEPSINVYAQQESYPDCALAGNMRSFGFHIHVSDPILARSYEKCRDMAKLMDLKITLPLLPHDINDYNRRIIYGKAGEIRLKKYGFEYRTLGSGILRDRTLVEFVFNQTQECLRLIKEDNYQELLEESEIIEEIINSNDLDFVNEYQLAAVL